MVFAAAVLGAALGAQPAAAEVVDSGEGGFTARTVVQVALPPQDAYLAFLQIAAWWNPNHTYTGDAAALSLSPEVGGCWCERFPDGGGVEHMRVSYVTPGSAIRFLGGLGPLQGIGATGPMTVTFEAREGEAGSTVSMTYVVQGYQPGGMAAWAVPVDGVLAEAMGRYAAYADQGDEGG
jgi:uncharacterized protein YndB with AHSA1/START domain